MPASRSARRRETRPITAKTTRRAKSRAKKKVPLSAKALMKRASATYAALGTWAAETWRLPTWSGSGESGVASWRPAKSMRLSTSPSITRSAPTVPAASQMRMLLRLVIR